MALIFRQIYIVGFLFLFVLSGCDKTPSDPDPDPSQISLEITAPSADQTYWTDRSIPCSISTSANIDEASWTINDEAVSCIDGEFVETPSAGEYEVTVAIGSGDNFLERSATIVVKEGFSVTLNKPKADSNYFVGDEVSCEATVDPEKYEEYLEISVNGKSCTDDTVRLESAGQPVFRASATVGNRTESDEATVTVNPVVAGKIHPLTSDGVSGQAGNFSVTLRAGGEVIDTQTTTDGSFVIKADFVSQLGSEEVELEVAESSDFYGARAVLPASELLALVESDELGFVLAPKTWHIRDGKHSGRSANLKLKDAFTRVLKGDPNDPDDFGDAGSSFYKLLKVFGTYKYVSVFSERLPLPVAFNREESDVDITESDSTDFWQQTDNFTESYIGRGNLFSPTTIAQIPSVFDGIQVYSGNAGDRSGAAGASGEEGYIVGGHIDLAIDKFGDYIQTHEQIHNLGFGHASQWDGLMTYEVFHGPNGERIEVPGKFREKLTVDDIAHIQVYIDAFDLQFSQGISFGVLEWMLALDIKGLLATTSSQAKTHGKHTDSFHYETIECDIH